jgi:hypothetical protein
MKIIFIQEVIMKQKPWKAMTATALISSLLLTSACTSDHESTGNNKKGKGTVPKRLKKRFSGIKQKKFQL